MILDVASLKKNLILDVAVVEIRRIARE